MKTKVLPNTGLFTTYNIRTLLSDLFCKYNIGVYSDTIMSGSILPYEISSYHPVVYNYFNGNLDIVFITNATLNDIDIYFIQYDSANVSATGQTYTLSPERLEDGFALKVNP